MRTSIRNHHCSATGMSSSLGDVTATLRIDVDDATCARERKSGRRENATHVMSNTVLQAAQLCDDGVSDMRRGWRRTPALSVNGREQSVIITAAAKTAVTL